MNKTKVILVGGRQRAGKSTFAKLLAKQLGDSAKVYNFAYVIKKELKPLIWETYGLDSFSEVSEEKEKFRSMLIEFGREKRLISAGSFFRNRIADEIRKDNPKYAIIGDWRYNRFENDEYSLVREFPGIALHVTKWVTEGGRRFEIPSTNADENENDPIIKNVAHYHVNWTDPQNGESVENWCNHYVSQFLEHYKSFFCEKTERNIIGRVG